MTKTLPTKTKTPHVKKAKFPKKTRLDEAARIKKKAIALKAFSETGVVGDAARAAGVTTEALRHWREIDKDFMDAWMKAEEDAKQLLVDECVRRGRVGWREPVIHNGRMSYVRDPNTDEVKLDENGDPIPLTVIKKSDAVLQYITTKMKGGWDTTRKLEMSGPNGQPLIPPPTEIVVRFMIPSMGALANPNDILNEEDIDLDSLPGEIVSEEGE